MLATCNPIVRRRAAAGMLAMAGVVLVGCGGKGHSMRDALPASMAESDSTRIQIRGPTLIGFVPANADSALDPDSREALDDFDYHLGTADSALRTLGFRITVVEGRRFLVAQSARVDTFIVPKDSADIGYYLIAPGRAPVVGYGVQTNSDLIEMARRYLQRRTGRP